MAGLRKPVLYALFDRALLASGWQGYRLPSERAFPAHYHLTYGLLPIKAVVYIWTISHGGGAKRAANEFRIQITGLDHFTPQIGGKTLILGWWPEASVFAGFDYNHHDGSLGDSPSIQVGEEALRRAAEHGMAVHTRGNHEIVVIFRPEFLGVYLDGMNALHRIGLSVKEIALLGRIITNPNAVLDSEIEAEVAAPRRHVLADVRRAVRDARFSRNVLAAYGQRCAFCGVQLRLLDAAHILPVAHPDSSDLVRNGVAACSLHHRAYDQGLITFDVAARVHVSTNSVTDLQQAELDGGLTEFRNALRKDIILPNPAERPLPTTVRAANRHRGWSLS